MTYSAPGVFIKYVTDGPLSIRPVSTSTPVFIGPTVVGSSINAGVVEPKLITSLKDYSDEFSTKGCKAGAVSLPTPGNSFIDYMGHAFRGFALNGGTKAYVVSLSTGTPVAASTVAEITGSDGPLKFSVTALSAGAWGNSVNIKFETSSLGQDFCDIEISLTVSSDNGERVQTERSTGQPIADIAKISSNIVSFTETTVGSPIINLNVAAAIPPADEDDANLADGENAFTTKFGDMSAVFEVLKDFDDISLITLPGRIWPADQPAYETAIAHCQAMKDRMVLLQLDDATTNFGTTGVPQDKYASVYYPSATVALKTPGEGFITQTVGTTSHIAGIFARTDNDKGPWTAPAGMHASIAGITTLTKEISQTRQESINPQNINALRYIEGIPVVWGARTRDMGGIYEYIPVMRTAFLIADSLREALNKVVFAKNTETLWKNVKAGVNGFMDSLFIRGAFQGATPSQAYEVACGLGESMTQAEIDTGLLRVTVRFRPAKPAEFIEVSIEQLFENAA